MLNNDYNIEVLIKAQNLASAEIAKLNDQVKKLETGVNNTNKSIGGTYGNLKRDIAGLGLGKLFMDQAKAVLVLGGNLEQSEIAFTTMLGSEEKALTMLKELTDFAKKTPFELVGIRDSAKQLLAMGITQEKMIPTLKALGDVSAGLGVPLERLAYNYGQVASQGKLTGKELRDFAMAGVPILSQLTTQLGKTKEEVQDMIESGQVTAEMVETAFKGMTDEGGKFANLMDKQSKTLLGSWSNLNDSLNTTKEALGKALIPMLTKLLGAVLPVVEKVAIWVQENPKLASTIFIAVGAIAGLGAALVVLGPIFTAVIGAITAIGGALMLLSGPIGLAIGLIAALYVAYRDNLFGIKDLVDNTLKALKDLWQKHGDEITSIMTIFASVVLGIVTLGMSEIVIAVINNWDTIKTTFNTGVEAVITVWNTLKDAVKSVRDAIVAFIMQKVDAIMAVIEGFITKIKTAVSNIKSLVSDLSSANDSTKSSGGAASANRSSIGKRAGGGPVFGGTPYMVGERGPELFIPSGNGQVVQNGKSGAGQNFTFNFGNISGLGSDIVPMIEETVIKAVRNFRQGLA